MAIFASDSSIFVAAAVVSSFNAAEAIAGEPAAFDNVTVVSSALGEVWSTSRPRRAATDLRATAGALTLGWLMVLPWFAWHRGWRELSGPDLR